MIYLKTQDLTLMVLEPANIARLQLGQMASSPDGHVVIGYTPDAVWAAEELARLAPELTPTIVADVIRRSLSRAEVFTRTGHPEKPIIRDGKLVEKDGE